MTNQEKATSILAIIMDELNMPKGSTIGDIAFALSSIDPENEIMSLLKPVIRDAVIDEIKTKIA
jgi:hypothetical protein